MRLAILGGGGFRVPLVYGALLRDHSPGRVTEVVLHDPDAGRLAAVALVLEQLGVEHSDPPRVTTTDDLDTALRGADFVFSAIRVGGLAGRTRDERVALDLGVLGQETTGPGGLAYALRTVPVALDIAERTRRLAPDAWFINFTNPAGIVTEAMQSVLGDRVIGICDSPIALARRAIGALGLDPDVTEIDYVGLNHLGWLRALRVDGVDHLPRLLADPAALLRLEEGRLFGAGVAARPRRAAQRVPLLLLLHPRGGGLDPRRRARPAASSSSTSSRPSTTPWPATPSGRRPSGGGHASSVTPRTCARRGPRARSATRPTSRAAATRGWRWRSWRRSAGARPRR